MHLLITRRGESEANLAHEFSNRGLKHPLTPRGVAQATALAQRLRPIGVHRVYSSPVLRAIHTTQVITTILGIRSFVVSEDLREYDVGVLEGRSDPEGWELYAEMERRWGDPARRGQRIEGGESFHEIQGRWRRFLDGLARDQGLEDAHVLVVTHGGLLKVGLPGTLLNLEASFPGQAGIGNCELIRAELIEGRWQCTEWGGQSLQRPS